MAVPVLAGLQVLVTRPAHQADSLCAAIEAAGGVALRLPLLAIEAVTDAAAAQQALDAAQTADAWIFTSTNAVDFAGRLGAPSGPERQVAVGTATAAALRRRRGRSCLEPGEGDSDGAAGVLALPMFADPRGQRLVIIGGEAPLPDLAAGLAARGAQVRSIAVYRRVALKPAADAIVQALDRADIAIVSSAATVAALVAATPVAAKARLLQLPLAVPSARVVEKAREAGFRGMLSVPARITDSDWLDLLESWLHRDRRDRHTDPT